MTFVERPARLSTLGPARGSRTWHRAMASLASVVVVLATMTMWSSHAEAASIQAEKARAAQLYSEIQRIQNQTQYLGQKYDLAHIHVETLVNEIRNTKQIVKSIQSNVSRGEKALQADAIFAYVTNGQVNGVDPLFTPNATNVGATSLYNNLAEGNVGSTIASLKNNRIRLTQEKYILRDEVNAAAVALGKAREAYNKAATLQYQVQGALNQVKGQIASYYAAIAAAAAAKAAAALRTAQGNPTSTQGVPGADPVAQIAIHAAESLLGVPYCWGGASRSCVDCSGLTMLAYQAAGIYFPHYSGAQFDDTQRVPLWDIQPGDLLFYGYNGDEHVAMYVGHGMMIEAPHTGAYVHITPIRLGYGFAGLGRPRA